ncbi:ParB/RepB/Spo0J family partition protein [Polyangium sp. y55x31]|uniref:ParB/RepB/Spo0J family partition protein n=1 Tax=Polyangium sp. y55x31 TaxID=3042688 RepID=UPI0024829906|nr:ParB/RepB/Spo0J family partition protein [Polyangium sp. y55x31]MDI1476110.1 ParB/RepB/Spo0J family partition protein [Polyangium sp. y55x31]
MSTDPKNAPRRALGRGLDALLPAAAPPSPSGASYGDKSVFTCPIERIGPQPGQPRQHFDDEALEELAASIREHGILEPIVVRRPQAGADKYEIIAGERRWRAAQRAGLKDVLVVVKDVSPKEAFELALVENVQREDLNPIELAEAFDRLLKEHGYTQESLAERVGKNRTTVTNSLRLLKLPARVRSMVIGGDLSEGHARALLGAPDDKAMEDIADKAVRGRLPVRKVEELVRSARGPKEGGGKGNKADGPAPKSPGVKDLEARLMRKLGAKVEVRDKDGRGEIAVAYGSLDELDRILNLLGA